MCVECVGGGGGYPEPGTEDENIEVGYAFNATALLIFTPFAPPPRLILATPLRPGVMHDFNFAQ